MECVRCGLEISGPDPLCPRCGALAAERTESRTGRDPTDGVDLARLPSPTFGPGDTIGDRYQVVEEVGQGGMGQVYKAIDRRLGKAVALKITHPQVASRVGAEDRFMRELRMAQQVTHPNVCRVYDLGELLGFFYITMEYIDGQSLRDLIQAMGRLSPLQTVTLARQVCAALEAIHERSIVHRDLKPGNIMVDRSGHVFVMDFGMAYREGDDRITDEGRIVGTLAYLSPEQARGQAVDWRSDIYSLGLVLFEMLTGKRPPADGVELPLALRDSWERCPPPSRIAPEVPPALDSIVLRCLERDPSRRFTSVGELDQALAAVAASLPTGSGHSPFLRTALPVTHPLRFAWALPLVLALAVGIWVRVYRPALSPGPPGSVALLALGYEGPDEHASLRQMIPLLVSDKLRAQGGLQVAPFVPASEGFDSRAEPGSVARQLGVGSVVQGGVKVRGDEFDVTLLLTLAQGPREGSSKTLKGSTQDPFPVAAEAARWLAVALVGQAQGGESAHRDPSAIGEYYKGRIDLEGWDVHKNYQRAEEDFTRAIQLDDSLAEAHAGLALALWTDYQQTQEGARVAQALKEAERAVQLNPLLPESHLALGVVQLGQGRSPEAAASLKKAQELAPGDDAVARKIAKAYEALKRYPEAEAEYQRAIDLRPGYWWNHNSMGSYFLRRANFPRAKELFIEVIRLRPDSDTGFNNLAMAYLAMGDSAAAEPLLRAALKLHPSVQAHNNLGAVCYANGRYAEAIREYREAIDRAPKQATPWGNLGDSYRQLGRVADARDAYSHAIELGEAKLQVDPTDAEARALLAVSLAGAGRCPEARQHAERADRDAAQYPLVHLYLAQAFIVCGEGGPALEEASRAIEGGASADVKTNPDLKPLLQDPTIRKLLRLRVNP
jgi:tetratricopeptide (TPR) repeat protein/predicted Ser/Thr protein kinase